MKKISITGLMSLIMLLSSATPVFAQGFRVEAKSAAEFAREGDSTGKAFATALDKTGVGKVVICGDAENICNTETEVCLKGVYNDTITVTRGGRNSNQTTSTTHIEIGKCVPKENLSSDLSQYFKGTGCFQESVSRQTGANVTVEVNKCTITIESIGWINQSSTKIHGITTSSSGGESFIGADGKTYTIYLMSDQPTVQYGNNKGGEDFEGCDVLPVKIYNMQSCFFCPLAELIFSASNDVTNNSFAYFAGPLKSVIIIVFAIWLAFMALQQVFSMTKQDAPKFLSAILKQGFKVLFAFALLSYSGDLFRYFIVPVLDGGLQMGTAIQTVDMPTPKNWEPTHVSTPQIYYNVPIKATKEINIKYKDEDKTITADTLYTRIEIFLASLQARMSYLQAIGTTLFCVGGHEIITIKASEIKQGFEKMMLGGILTVFGFLLAISFAFYFMDALLQLAVIGAMLPLMIAGWPLKATSQYATTGLKMLLNTFFVMFFTGFVVSVDVSLIDNALGISQTQNNDETKENSQVKGLNAITQAITDQNIAQLTEATNIGASGFLLLIFSCLLGFKFVAQVTPLASSLSSGGFKGGLAGRIGTMGASTIKGMAIKATKPVGQAVADQYHAAGGVVGIVGKPIASVGGLVGKAVGGADQEGKSWKDKSTRGKIGAAISGITSAPHRFAKKVHSVYRKPRSGS